MKYKFNRDYRGKATNERYFVAGSESDLEGCDTKHLLDNGVVSELKTKVAPKPKTKVEPKQN